MIDIWIVLAIANVLAFVWAGCAPMSDGGYGPGEGFVRFFGVLIASLVVWLIYAVAT